MAEVTGAGGFFFKTDKEATARWFTDVLALPAEAWGRMFPWREREQPDRKGYTALGLHSVSTRRTTTTSGRARASSC